MTLKTTLYVGLNDKDTKKQEIESSVCKQVLLYTMLGQHLDGTILDAQGVYTHDDGTVTVENSFKIELLCFMDEKEFMDKIKKIVDYLKVALNQESVAVVREYINSELW